FLEPTIVFAINIQWVASHYVSLSSCCCRSMSLILWAMKGLETALVQFYGILEARLGVPTPVLYDVDPIGNAIGKLHDGGLVHGDLTINNQLSSLWLFLLILLHMFSHFIVSVINQSFEVMNVIFVTMRNQNFEMNPTDEWTQNSREADHILGNLGLGMSLFVSLLKLATKECLCYSSVFTRKIFNFKGNCHYLYIKSY
ncbi:hypothetical protein ACJX0J_041340, partial [Zea mays]